MEAVGEGRSQYALLCTCICERVHAARTAEIQALKESGSPTLLVQF